MSEVVHQTLDTHGAQPLGNPTLGEGHLSHFVLHGQKRKVDEPPPQGRVRRGKAKEKKNLIDGVVMNPPKKE